ncbi:hypothetical protein C0995_015194 [Termitomyces sp. Mi166|nr:hypothetical protein C0995_015194 [Termitomyces sp. Mi166\
MPYSETSLHWALNKLATRIPLSCSSSPTTVTEDALLAALLRTPLRRGSSKTTQPQTVGPLPAISRQLTDVCFAAAQRLRDVCAATGRVDYDESKRLVEFWDAAHAEQARVWAEDAFASVRAAVSHTRSAASPQPNAKPRKPAFHHEYTPLLDKYFEFNAYPSAPDRAVLARKCMMSPRQIEVWFQNHRNRARKDGKPLRRLTHHPLPPELTLELSLESLEKKMPYFIIPVHERLSQSNCHRNIVQNNSVGSVRNLPFDTNVIDWEMQPAPNPVPTAVPSNATSNIVTSTVLNPPPPPHAFPTVYSPRNRNPFQVQDRVYTFPAPIWQRKPAKSFSIPKTCVDMNEFILVFNQKLHLRAPAVKKCNPSSQPWCVGRVTIPFQAPHPALVQSLISPTMPSLFEARTDASPRHTLYSPTSSSHPLIIIPPQSSGATRRKVAGLPKRTPSSASTTHRRDSPAISEVSSVLSPSPFRSSSFGSDTSSHRYSSSSSSSTCSSTLTTPVLSHSVLFEDPCIDLHKQDIYHSQMPISSSREAIISNLSRTPQ